MSEEQAAQQDPNMPPLDVSETGTAATETPKEEGQQVDTAPTTEVDEQKSDFVDQKDISERTQAKINKITAEKYAEKRRADELERKLTEQAAQIPQAQPQNVAEPKLEDFDYDEAAHTAALIDYKVNQKAEQIQQAQQQQVQQQAQQATQNTFHEKVAAFEEKAPDYQQVVANIPQLPGETLDAVMQAKSPTGESIGPQLAYHLGKHLDVADEIANSTPVVAAMKLGQISAQLTATTKTVNTSAAPDPIEPVGSGGVSDTSVEEMSMEQIYNM